MKNPGSTKAIISSTLCLLIICLAVTSAIVVTNAAFEERIAEQELKSTQDAMAELLEADKYELFTADDDSDAYRALDASGGTLGYIFITAARGYGSAISVMTAISEGEVIAISILDCADETPGLGQNVTAEDFTKQFAGLTSAPQVTKGTPSADNEIQALTGATKSSKGVANAVESAFSLYEAAVKQEA